MKLVPDRSRVTAPPADVVSLLVNEEDDALKVVATVVVCARSVSPLPRLFVPVRSCVILASGGSLRTIE